MAISFSLSRLLALVVLLLAYSSGCFADRVDQVCARTTNPSFCNQFLRSDPRAAAADFRGLGIIATTLAVDPAGDLNYRLKGLIARASDVELRKRFQVCSGYANNAINELIQTRQFLTNKDYFNMFNHASRIYSNVALCDRQFAKPPPNEPAELIQASRKVRDVASVISAIANILLGRDAS